MVYVNGTKHRSAVALRAEWQSAEEPSNVDVEPQRSQKSSVLISVFQFFDIIADAFRCFFSEIVLTFCTCSENVFEEDQKRTVVTKEQTKKEVLQRR